MKKLLAVFLLFALLFSLAACSSTSTETAAAVPDTTTTVLPADASIQSANSTPTSTPIPADGLKSDGKIHVYLVGEGEKVYTPNSSFINYLTYFPSSEHLIICMKGNEYVFANVSSSLWSDFKAADSAGEFYNQRIRDNTAFYINDYDGSNGDLIVLDYVG